MIASYTNSLKVFVNGNFPKTVQTLNDKKINIIKKVVLSIFNFLKEMFSTTYNFLKSLFVRQKKKDINDDYKECNEAMKRLHQTNEEFKKLDKEEEQIRSRLANLPEDNSMGSAVNDMGSAVNDIVQTSQNVCREMQSETEAIEKENERLRQEIQQFEKQEKSLRSAIANNL